MSEKLSCPFCGASRTPADRFCGSCGGDLTQASAKVPAKPAMHKTMLGMSPVASSSFQSPTTAVEAPRAGTPSQADPAHKAHAKTMLGMVSPFAKEGAPQPSAPAAAPPSAQTPAAPNHKKTMLGMSVASLAQPAPASVVKAAPGEVPGKALTSAQPAPFAGKQTSFGVSEDEAARGAKNIEPLSSSSEGPPAKFAPSNRTMLGVSPVAAVMTPPREPEPQAALKPALAFTPAPDTPRATPSAQANPRFQSFDQPVREFTRPESKPEIRAQTGTDSFSDLAAALPKQGGGLRIAVIALVVVALLGAAAAWFFTSRGPALSVRVVNDDGAQGGDLLEVDVPASKPGTKVRFFGAERALEAGRARFPLSADALRVGENELAIDVIAPDGDVETAKVALSLAYRVRADVSPLAMTPPAVDIVVDLAPGARVVLDGEPLPVDASGHGIRRYVVPPQTGTLYTLEARYRIEAEGAPADGVVRLSLPVTSMQIDRPGPDAVTDQDAIEIAGEVESGATVSISQVAVGATDGRFLYRAPLTQEGDFGFDVIARAPNKVPRQAKVQVRRVHDMTMAAASFVADKSLTYARIAQNPNIYRGQKVSFDGRVYNVEVEGGRSVLQLLVRDCPGTQRCALWVEYGQATEATVDTWVRVLGQVTGEHQFQTKKGVPQTLPAVSAQYVLRLLR